MPLFDLLMQRHYYDVDTLGELEKCKKACIEEYGYIMHWAPKELKRSPFAKAVHLARLELERCWSSGFEEEGSESTFKDIEQYLKDELENIELPALETPGFTEEE